MQQPPLPSLQDPPAGAAAGTPAEPPEQCLPGQRAGGRGGDGDPSQGLDPRKQQSASKATVPTWAPSMGSPPATVLGPPTPAGTSTGPPALEAEEAPPGWKPLRGKEAWTLTLPPRSCSWLGSP
ncbi:small nuclear ribonucleoprotein-associated protein B'-like isoform X3 [Hemicordylus capensis]|uniref:small nuclear ribonucleoprotein-associated protein B'-like isoform X3 n=1 Tax=Hemicordylus capensis TaxID=884348 RepID=UPI002302CF6A|nr:small nuclear ribonucleoprotein-associated protein B'-like isoform X3 [Hemicordylus capensis]